MMVLSFQANVRVKERKGESVSCLVKVGVLILRLGWKQSSLLHQFDLDVSSIYRTRCQVQPERCIHDSMFSSCSMLVVRSTW